jgi:hypothetical protein
MTDGCCDTVAVHKVALSYRNRSKHMPLFFYAEERFIYYYFVSSDYTLIEEAKQNWNVDKFPKVAEEHDRIPLPDQASHLKARH